MSLDLPETPEEQDKEFNHLLQLIFDEIYYTESPDAERAAVRMQLLWRKVLGLPQLH